MISIQGNKTSIKKVHVCKSLHCFMQLQKSHNPEQQRNELCLSVRSGWRNERYAVGFFFSQPALGLLLEKERGAGGAVWLRLIYVMMSPDRRLRLHSLEGKHPLCHECLTQCTLNTFTITQTLSAVTVRSNVTVGKIRSSERHCSWYKRYS